MKRKKEYLWIIGIIIVLLLMISLAVFKTKSNYQGNESLVYSYNGWLYYNNESNKLGRGSYESVKYARNREDFLYKIENDLYLHKSHSEFKVMTEAKDYEFSADDEYVVALNIDNTLGIYVKGKLVEINKEVKKYLGMYKNSLYYYKDNIIYLYNISKNESKELLSDIANPVLKNNKLIYLDKENNLNVYEVDTLKNVIKLDSVIAYNYNDDLTKIAYLNKERELYLYEASGKIKIDSDVINIVSTDEYIVYNKLKDDSLIYYIAKGNNKKEFSNGGLNSCSLNNEKMYCISLDGTLYSISKKIEIDKIIDNVFDKIYEYNDKLYIVSIKNNKNVLYKIENDKLEVIDDNVVYSSVMINDNKMYYLKVNKDRNDLYAYNDNESMLISEKIDKYYIMGKNIYLLKNYDEKTLKGSLYLYNFKKDKLVIENMTDLAV